MLRLRAMRDSDLVQIRAIEGASHPLPWSVAYFRRLLHRRYACFTLAAGERIAGYGVMRVHRGTAHIMNVTVTRAFRRQGLATRLVKHLLLEARRLGAQRAVLEVRPSNLAAIRLYRTLGFRRAGLRRHYYPGPGVKSHAALMSCDVGGRRY